MTHVLKIENLQVSVEGKPILRGVDLELKHGETHALMGPNGSGKSNIVDSILFCLGLSTSRTMRPENARGYQLTEAVFA